MRQYAKSKAAEVGESLQTLIDSLYKKAAANNVIMPGYTHLQRAQVVTFSHHLGAYAQMFKRDKKRVHHAIEIMDENPQGCGALAGTTHNIDRNITTELLGFEKSVDNFLDGVSDRDYLLELMADYSIIMMHLSRLSEKLILWSSQEFQFIKMDDAYSTGSSIMPQKENPDAAELIRGKTGRVDGSLFALRTTLKGMPFRDTHSVVGQLIIYCEEQERAIEDLTVAELATFSELLTDDIYEYIDYETLLTKGNKGLMKQILE